MGEDAVKDGDQRLPRLSRRALLRGVTVTAGGALLASCTAATRANWTFGPASGTGASGAPAAPAASAAPGASAVAASASAGASATASAPGSASPAASASPATSAAPAKAKTVDEISRHPSVLADSADYGLYADGKYQGRQPRTGRMTHEVHFTSREVVAEVVPGTTMDYWTFDGTVPGPMLRARVGDSLDFFLKNDAGNSMPHDVDFHAVTGPGGGSVRLDTLPGHESQLRVKLLHPGIFIYHCAFPDTPTHIAHGMYGLVVVEPEKGLPKVDREYYLLQSEFYTDQGGTKGYAQLKNAGHLAFSMDFANEERPTFVVFNGRPESIIGPRGLGVLDAPIKTGEKVRMFVGNIGPNLISSFHLIGEVFDTVYVEGSFALENHNVQSTIVPAGGATGVEFTVNVPGSFVLVDHAIFRIHKGAAGELVVTGKEDPTIYDPVKYDEGLRGSSPTH